MWIITSRHRNWPVRRAWGFGALDDEAGESNAGSFTINMRRITMKRIIASLLTIILLLSLAAMTSAEETTTPATAEYTVVKEYKWQSSTAYHNDLVITNNSGFDALIYLDVLFFDKDGKVVGVADSVKGGCENGHDTFWSISNDLPFDHIEYEFTLVPDTQNQSIQSVTKLSVNILENGKVIFSATNTSDKTIDMLECFLIFLDENGNVVDSAWEFLGDFDGEIKPGVTIYGEVKSTKNYTSVDLYATTV
jgi:uncharacterized protein YuzE